MYELYYDARIRENQANKFLICVNFINFVFVACSEEQPYYFVSPLNFAWFLLVSN